MVVRSLALKCRRMRPFVTCEPDALFTATSSLDARPVASMLIVAIPLSLGVKYRERARSLAGERTLRKSLRLISFALPCGPGLGRGFDPPPPPPPPPPP